MGVRSAVEFTSHQIRTDMGAVYLTCRYKQIRKNKATNTIVSKDPIK